MRAVNLLPKDAQQRGKSLRAEDPAVVVGSAVGVVVFIALIAGFLNVHSKVNAEQSKLTAARAELAQLAKQKRPEPVNASPVKQKPIIPIPAVTAEEQPRLAAITSALSTRIAWDRILREFSLVLPTDVWLSSLTLTTPPPGPVSGTGIVLIGTTYSYDSVARLLSRLALVPDLGGVTLASTTRSGRLIQFTVNAGVKGAPAPVVAPAPTATTTTTPGASS